MRAPFPPFLLRQFLVTLRAPYPSNQVFPPFRNTLSTLCPTPHPPSRPRPTFLSTWVAPVSQVSPHTSTSAVPSSVLLHLQAKTKPRKICARPRGFPQSQGQAQIRRVLQPQYLALHL